jgi:hypothetical protein
LTGKGEVNGPIDLSGLNAQQFRIHKEGFASGGLAQAKRFVTRLMTAPRQIVEDRDLILRESRAAATLRYNSAEKVLWCAIETSGND